MRLPDEIGGALKDKGITLDELTDSGREIRQELTNKKTRRTTNK
jgi:hypothetical protein